MRNLRFITTLLLAAIGVSVIHAYTLRQIDNSDGLSNSAVLSLGQDDGGRLWIGTCDGLNLFDGREVVSFRMSESYPRLTGELISAMLHTSDGALWIATNYGLNRYSPKDNSLKGFTQFQDNKNISANSRGHMFVVSRGNAVYYYTGMAGRGFEHLQGPELGNARVMGFKAEDDRLWFFTDRGVGACALKYEAGRYRADDFRFVDNASLKGCYIHDGEVLCLDGSGRVSVFLTDCGQWQPITDIEALAAGRGEVSDMLTDDRGRLFVAFATSGVVKLTPKSDGSFDCEDIGVKGGVFCLKADRNQDIVWIGADGNGLYLYVEDEYSFRTVTFADLRHRITRPVRAIYFDDYGTLWLGTKGDGILKIKNFKPWNRGERLKLENVTKDNSLLLDNAVYAFAPSRHGGMWVGSDRGLNYARGSEGALSVVETEIPIPWVHDIYEADDTTLWLATVGSGVYRGHIAGDGGVPRLDRVTRLAIEDGNMSSNYFFTLHHEDNGHILAGNRGLGLFEVDGDNLRDIALKGKYHTKMVNDVYAIAGDDKCRWLGTATGLLKMTPDGERLWNGNNGFPNSTVHSLMKDGDGNLWVSTNQGLVRFDLTTENYQVYRRGNGLDVTEFSDGAAFKQDKTLFFGGINGFVVLQANADMPKGARGKSVFRPMISLRSLNLAGRNVAAIDYIKPDDDGADKLELDSDENTFTVNFNVPDFIDTESYAYLYRINDDKNWMRSSVPGSVSFTSMPYGDYTLRVKAVNLASGQESMVKTLVIHINAPWYLSVWAKMAYILLGVGLLWFVWQLRRRISRRRHMEFMRKVRHEQREQTYEEKLRFFTNITHEFCTPLTLIYGPCERILSHSESDPYIKRYASIIKSNTERLNSLIQEVIDFRRVETGNQKVKIAKVDVTGLCNDVMASFSGMVEQRGVALERDIAPDLVWPTDYGCFTKIVYNLVSNAFKYTPDGGVIRFTAKQIDNSLQIRVYNTGKGIKPEDKSKIFNRYTILDNVEENATRGLSSRNGLGMAICHSMTELLGGGIAIESEVDRYAEFIVTLPWRKPDEDAPEKPVPAAGTVGIPLKASGEVSLGAKVVAAPHIEDMQRRQGDGSCVLVIDDNPDILSLLADSLTEYDVVTASNAEEAMEKAKERVPDLIVTDIMMPGTDGLELARRLKQDRHMNHVPVVILSARNSSDDKVEGLQSGADAYVTKPFTLSYLRAVIDRLLKRRSEMREYYNSSASAYQYANGKLLDLESKQFVDNLNAYIEENLDNPELSPESLAAHFQTSTRNLYRKMKDLELLPPNDFIKDHRITFATKLLVTTSLTVQEIIYRCGFNNRSHFYKEFDKRHGMTPKDYRLRHKTPGCEPEKG